MAGYSVTVCLPATAAADVRVALAEALAPFGESSDLYWDQGSLWDSWRIKGGSDGYGFWAASGFEEDQRLIHDDPALDGQPRLSLPGHCAGGSRALLDLTQRPTLGRQVALQTWDLWQRLGLDHPPALPVSAFVARHQKTPRHGFDHELVISEFEAQPLVSAFHAAHPVGARDRARCSADYVFHPGRLIGFTGDGDSFADAVVERKLGGSDLLTLDGWWIESYNRAANHAACGSACGHKLAGFDLELAETSFAEAQARYLEALPADALIVRVYGHC